MPLPIIRIHAYTHSTTTLHPFTPYTALHTHTHTTYMSLAPIYPLIHTQHFNLPAHVCPITRSRPSPQVCHASTTTLSRLRDNNTHYRTHRHTLGHTGTGRGGAIISIMSIPPIISISIIKKNNLYCWRKVMCYIDLKTPAPKPCCRSGHDGTPVRVSPYNLTCMA